MAAIVAILVLGVKNAKSKAPIDVKNMKNEKGKVKRDFLLTLISLEKAKEMSIASSGSVA